MLTAAIVFLLVLIAILTIPVTLMYQVSWQQAFQGTIKLQWLFGLVCLQLPLFQPKASFPKSNEVMQEVNSKKESSWKKLNPIAAIQQKPFRQRSIKFIRDFWYVIHKQNVRLYIRIGLGDPADTGQIWAIAGPVSGILANYQEASIEIEPEFIDKIFELDSSGNIRVIPLRIIYLTIGLLLSPSIWHGLKQMCKAE